jgi:hypothetical protein
MQPKVTGEESPRWSFMRVRRIRGSDGSVYLWRLYILSTPWFGLMLHRIFRPDRQRDLHDHPWNFLSVIVLGWYGENIQRPGGGQQYVKRRRFNFKFAEDRHSIRTVSRVPVWTLVFTGRRRRDWGFWTPVKWSWRCEPCDRAAYGVLPPICTAHGEMEQRYQLVHWREYERLNDA